MLSVYFEVLPKNESIPSGGCVKKAFRYLIANLLRPAMDIRFPIDMAID